MSAVATPVTATPPNPDHALRLAQELNVKVFQVAATAQLLASGATVPFIARYRKETTGELDEVQVTAIRDRLEQLQTIDERRAAILASLKERNLLTPELEKAINAADTLTALEDIYPPFRPKKRTRATIAKEKGLEPLADLLFAQDPAADVAAAAQAYVGNEYVADDGRKQTSKIASADEALAGARDIIAERVSDDKDARAKLRAAYQKDAVVSSKIVPGRENDAEAAKFKDYFDWSESLAKKMAADIGATGADLLHDGKLRAKIKPGNYATADVGLPTLNDIMTELAKPGRDPRQKFEAFSFADGVNKPEDLRPGMKLPGIVTNVTAFGAFVDIGVHQDGLVHVSQLADAFVKDPATVVRPQQKVMVTVTEVDLARQRIALSMRSKPEIGPKTGTNAGSAPRTSPGGPRPGSGPRPTTPPAPQPPPSLTSDWFSAALKKKR